MITNVNNGDNFAASKMNEIKTDLDLIYTVAVNDYVNHAVANLFPFNEQDGERDNVRDSNFAFLHKHRYLIYAMDDPDDHAIIIDPSGLNADIALPEVEVDEYGEYDLSSVSWLSVGMMYYVKRALWALEVQKGDYVYG